VLETANLIFAVDTHSSNAAPNSARETESKKDTKQEQDLDVDLSLNSRALDRSSRGISLQFCVVASEDDKTVQPGSISQLSTTKEDLIGPEGYLLLSCRVACRSY
jgi:hypothetical protein